MDKSVNFVDNSLELCKKVFDLSHPSARIARKNCRSRLFHKFTWVERLSTIGVDNLSTSSTDQSWPTCFQQLLRISYKRLIERWIRCNAYPPYLGISYPHSCLSSITSLFLSPSPPSLSTSGTQLSPFYTALSPSLITYPQGIRCLYRLIATYFIVKSGASPEAYPLIHRAYYYYGNIYIFKKRWIIVYRPCG